MASLAARPSVSKPILIDSGPSAWGASYYGDFLKCRQLFAYRRRLLARDELSDEALARLAPTEGLTFGSMGHTGLAHLHARQGAAQYRAGKLPESNPGVLVGTGAGDVWVTDADQLLEPEDAVRAWCDVHGRGHECIEQVFTMLDRYQDKYPEPPGLVVGIECNMTAALGDADGEWGLWLTDGAPIKTRRAVAADRTRIIEMACLDAPGHCDHGRPILVTRRADMITLDSFRGDQAAIVDHKCLKYVEPSRAEEAYRSELGFGLFWLMAGQAFAPGANWLGGQGTSGVYVSLVQKIEPHRMARVKIRKTPSRNLGLPRDIYDAAHHIARLDLETAKGERSLWEWGRTQDSGTCMGRYSTPCGGYGLCFEE